MNACQYLSLVGFNALRGSGATPDDEDDPDSIEAASLADNRRVREILLASDPKPLTGRDGIEWVRRITWPDRVPGLKTWAGNQKLEKIVAGLQKVIRAEQPDDLLAFRFGLAGASGIDDRTCQDAIDIGFSPSKLGMLVNSWPGMELLAIIGLETLPLLSFAPRVCGFIHDGHAWKFTVEPRDGGYYHRWADVERVREWDDGLVGTTTLQGDD